MIELWIVYVIIAFILMGINTFLVKVIVKNISPYVILFYQYLLAVPLVGVYAFFSNASFSLAYSSLVFLGVIYFIAFLCFYLALRNGQLSRVGPVFNLKFIVVTILGGVFLSESLSITNLIGLGFGIASVFLLGGEKS